MLMDSGRCTSRHKTGTWTWCEYWRSSEQTWRLMMPVDSGRCMPRHNTGTWKWCEFCSNMEHTRRLKLSTERSRFTLRRSVGVRQRWGCYWSTGWAYTPWTKMDAPHYTTRAARSQCRRCWRQGLISTAAAPVVLRTPLFVAAGNGHVPAVTALVQEGARPTASDSVWSIEMIIRAVEGGDGAGADLAGAE
jgi:hypothetical protein